MKALHITELKHFMNRLFLSEDFDAFRLSEAAFITFNTFHIDGRLKKEYYNTEEQKELPFLDSLYSSWHQVRPFCCSLIKGTHPPLEFKIVFRLSESNVKRLLQQSNSSFSEQDINGLFLTLHYQNNNLTCTTGTALSLFTLDKSLEHIWDEMVQKFLLQKNIIFELK